MRISVLSYRQLIMYVAGLALLSLQSVSALGQSGIKINGEGTLLDVPGGPSTFTLAGTASHLGLYTCYGEITFAPAQEDGSKDGVGAFTAANGDILVGVVDMHIAADGSIGIHFSWRDSVEFIDGRVICSTGRFEDKRPPGLRIQCKLVCFLGFCVITCS
jgi:hypothetical protein